MTRLHIAFLPVPLVPGWRDISGGAMWTETRVAAIATILATVCGGLWLVLESTPVRLGYEDTDDPTLMVGFIRNHPGTFTQAGVLLVLTAILLAVAVLAVRRIVGRLGPDLPMEVTTTFGLFAAAFLLFGAGVRVGSSGPLLHMAGLNAAFGEAAYVAAQVVSQAVLIVGVFGLCLWAVGLSVAGLRSKDLPRALCWLGVLPAYRIVAGLLAPVGLLPDVDALWVLGILSIFGTFLWLLFLGIVLAWRSVRDPRLAAVTAVLG